MKEIDTETPVIWPAWCYSRNLEVSEYLNKSLSKTTNFDESVDEQQHKDENHCVINKSSVYNNKSIDDIIFQKLPLKRKILKPQTVDEGSQKQSSQQQQQQQQQQSTVAINQQIEENNNIRKKRRKRSNTVETKMIREHSLLNSLANLNKLETPKTLEGSQITQTTIDDTTTAAASTSQQAAAATLLFFDQAKNEAAARLDSLKDAIMESAANALGNKNNTNNNNNNNNSMNVRNNSNHLLLSQVRNQNQLMASNEIDNSTSDVKRERLSPGTNGELLTNYSRCRSATPSPQQSLHISSPQPPIIPVHNLSTNLLNSLQATANCQSSQSAGATQSVPNATNYSDFMRSLAAKYNNTNPNDSTTPRRHAFFDNANLPSSSKMTSLSNSQKPAISILPEREASVVPSTVNSLISPVDLASAAFKSTNVQNQMVAAAAVAGVSPFMTSLLSTLPFPQGILAPWIDMSNTQALLILSRAAKEAKLEKTMRSMQSPKRSHSSASSSPRPNNNLSTALHQAAQLISPTLLYSAQAQKTQNLRSQQNSPAEAQHLDTETGDSSKMSTNLAVPLDLSSQPPVNKRFKAESTSSRSSVEELTNIVTSGLKRTSIAASEAAGASATATTTTTINRKTSSPTIQKVSTAPPTRQHVLKNSTAVTALSYRQQCQSQSEEVDAWTVDDVCTFVGSIDICAEYVENFRNQQIDGSGLPLLTEDHLVNWLGMKLGPALKLRSILAKKLGGPCPCVACVAQSQQILALNQQQQQQQQQQQLKRIPSRENSPTQIPVETTEQQQVKPEAVKEEHLEEDAEEDDEEETHAVEKSTTALAQEQEEQCCGKSNNNNNNNKNLHNQSKSGGNKGSNNGNNSCSEAIFLTCAHNNNNNSEGSFDCNSNINSSSSGSSNCSNKPNTNNNNNNNINNNKNVPSSTCNSNIVNNLSSYCNDTFKNNQNTYSSSNNNNNDIDTKILKQNYL